MYDYHVNKKYSLIDESFQPGFNGKHFLSIELSPGSFSYCILDNDRFQYRVLESYEFDDSMGLEPQLNSIEGVVRNNDFLISGFERITLVYVSKHSVFIPSTLFDEQEKDTYLRFNHIVQDDDIICSEKLYNLDAYVIYPLPDILKQTFDNLFSEYRLRHFSTALIESVLYDVRYGGYQADIVLHIQNGHFEIVILNSGNLVFFNSFNYQSWDDLLYYLFYVMEQSGLAAESLNIMIVGKASLEADIYKNLKLYFQNIDLGSRSDLFKYHEVFDQIPHNYFYNLLNVNACG